MWMEQKSDASAGPVVWRCLRNADPIKAGVEWGEAGLLLSNTEMTADSAERSRFKM